MPPKTYGIAVAFLLFPALLVQGAPPQQLVVGGFVRAAFHVDLVQTSAVEPCMRWERRSPASLRLWLTPGTACPSSIEIDVALRTNAPEYEFAISQESASPGLGVQFGLPRQSGAEVHALAAASFHATPGSPCTAQRCVATGTRISMRGTFSSPHNALIVPVTLALEGGPAPVPVDLLLREK